jgi:hypothetical protein
VDPPFDEAEADFDDGVRLLADELVLPHADNISPLAAKTNRIFVFLILFSLPNCGFYIQGHEPQIPTLIWFLD